MCRRGIPCCCSCIRSSRRASQSTGRREESEGTLGAKQLHDHAEYAKTIAIRIELADGAFGPRFVTRGDFGNGHAQFECVDGKLCLVFEAFRMRGKRLHVAAREYAIARRHVRESATEDRRDKAREHYVAEAMPETIRFLLVRMASRYDHVERVSDEALDHLRRGRGVVG